MVNRKLNIDTFADKSIFVQIASYRDPQLLPTLDNLLDKADRPEDLTICIAWQHSEEDEWDNLDKYKGDPRVIIIDIPYEESKGACWARNIIQGKYGNQAYTFQLDSHHRFIEGWDTELIGIYEELKKDGVQKPLLTSYIPAFNPDTDPKGRTQEPWWMTFDRFTPEGVIFFLPAVIPGWKDMTKPIPSRFYSAHFVFTAGKFCLEVPHDPEFYFHGEEITIAVRAFTHGYDLYHPHKVIAWHEYTRKGRTKNWDDNPNWTTANKFTYKQVRGLLGVDGEVNEKLRNSTYGLGKVRTLKDYEKYAGIRFRDRAVQRYTLDNKFAPNPEVDQHQNPYFAKFKYCINLHINSVPEDDYEFWVVAFQDYNGKDIYRKDCSKEELSTLLTTSKRSDGWIHIWREYNGPVPYKWNIWPYSTSKGWCTRVESIL